MGQTLNQKQLENAFHHILENYGVECTVSKVVSEKTAIVNCGGVNVEVSIRSNKLHVRSLTETVKCYRVMDNRKVVNGRERIPHSQQGAKWCLTSTTNPKTYKALANNIIDIATISGKVEKTKLPNY